MNSDGKTVNVYDMDKKVLISVDLDDYNMKEDIEYMLHLIGKTEVTVDRNMAMMNKCYGYEGIHKIPKVLIFWKRML